MTEKKRLESKMEKVELESELTLYPCPIVLVTCQDKNKKANIITISWAGIICSKPEKIMISVKPQRYSYDLIAESKEFVINIPTTKYVREMDICGTRSGRNVDKFDICNFTKSESRVISTPSINECPVSIECMVEQVLPVGQHHMFISKVVSKSIDLKYCTDDRSHISSSLDPII